MRELIKFIQKKQAVGMFVAIIGALAVFSIVKALVQNLLMPFLGLFTESGNWHYWVLKIGRLQLPLGDLVSEVLIFLLLIWFALGIVLYLKEEES